MMDYRQNAPEVDEYDCKVGTKRWVEEGFERPDLNESTMSPYAIIDQFLEDEESAKRIMLVCGAMDAISFVVTSDYYRIIVQIYLKHHHWIRKVFERYVSSVADWSDYFFDPDHVNDLYDESFYPRWIRLGFKRSYDLALINGETVLTKDSSHPLDAQLASLVTFVTVVSPKCGENMAKNILNILDLNCPILRRVAVEIFGMNVGLETDALYALDPCTLIGEFTIGAHGVTIAPMLSGEDIEMISVAAVVALVVFWWVISTSMCMDSSDVIKVLQSARCALTSEEIAQRTRSSLSVDCVEKVLCELVQSGLVCGVRVGGNTVKVNGVTFVSKSVQGYVLSVDGHLHAIEMDSWS